MSVREFEFKERFEYSIKMQDEIRMEILKKILQRKVRLWYTYGKDYGKNYIFTEGVLKGVRTKLLVLLLYFR